MEEELLFKHISQSGLMQDEQFIDCGRERCLPGKETEGEVVGKISIHAIVFGKGTLEYGDKKIELQQGDIFALIPGVAYKHYPNNDNPWQYFWVDLQSAMALEVLKNVGLDSSHPYLRIDKKRKVSTYLEKIVFNYEQKGYFSFEDLGFFYLFLDAILSNVNERHNIVSKEEFFVKQAIKFIANNKPCIKVEEIASSIGIHPNYFTAIFKKVLGISPKQYLIRKRMEMAKRMIIVDKIQIKQVSESLGFSNQLHFSKEFKKYFGCCPSKFKE